MDVPGYVNPDKLMNALERIVLIMGNLKVNSLGPFGSSYL